MFKSRRYIFPKIIFTQRQNSTQVLAKNQKGQTLVEFILLLASIVAIAYGFLRIMNTNLSEEWLRMSQTILEDKNQQLRIR